MQASIDGDELELNFCSENISLLQVNRILSENGSVKAVETNMGTVECQYFVNSSGTPLSGVYNMVCGGGGGIKA